MADEESQKQMSQRSTDERAPTNSGGEEQSEQNAANGYGMKSWYTKSWLHRPKAPAVTEIARESISSAGPLGPQKSSSTATLSDSSKLFKPPALGLTKKGGSSTRSLPADVATTRINIASTRSSSVPKVPSVLMSGKASKDNEPGKAQEDPSANPAASGDDVGNELAEGEKQNGEDVKSEDQEVPDKPTDPQPDRDAQPDGDQRPSSWFGWLSRTKQTPLDPTDGGDKLEERKSPNGQLDSKPEKEEEPENADAETTQPSSNMAEISTAQKRTWLNMLTSSGEASQESKPSEPERPTQSAQGPTEEESRPNDTESSAGSMLGGKADVITKIQHVPKSSASWLFWPKEQQKRESDGENSPRGEETSVSKTNNEQQNNPPTEAGETGKSAESTKKQNKKAATQGPPTASTQDDSSSSNMPTEPVPDAAKQRPPPGSRKAQLMPNQLLPSVKTTFQHQSKPGIIRRLGRWVYSDNRSKPEHVALVDDPPRIKKALAIGIHGYFPAPLIQTVLGRPTGTSVKFASQAANAINEWSELHGSPCEVEKIALEGEGHIEERVELLWKLLLDWSEHIKAADFIMIACHSQGVPVATMLAAKLVGLGCVSSTRIGICAMAGVNMGPFPDYRSRWISGSAGELFDFTNPSSRVSEEYMSALQKVLDHGVKITYVGSIDDQLVSLESSTFATISHPHIYRAVFVDGRVHAPSFLSHLIGFAMKLRNLGISDHGLVRELSSPLAGSLYTGEGHSRLYDDDSVYRMAVEYTLETTSIPHAVLQSHRRQAPPPNPYILPFAMRGLLEEEYVRRELSEETAALLHQFEEWKPSSKVLKDVKFRLEGIRSKL